jgi:hypothetical protein
VIRNVGDVRAHILCDPQGTQRSTSVCIVQPGTPPDVYGAGREHLLAVDQHKVVLSCEEAIARLVCSAQVREQVSSDPVACICNWHLLYQFDTIADGAASGKLERA